MPTVLVPRTGWRRIGLAMRRFGYSAPVMRARFGVVRHCAAVLPRLRRTTILPESCAMALTMRLELTAVFRKVPEGYVAYVEELPGANTQGATLDEARRNLREAVELIIEANRTLSEQGVSGADVIREPLTLPS